MKSFIQKLAEVAAQASGPQPAEGAPQGDPAEAGMAPEPDPIEQDNMKLNNVLQNLQLRMEIVKAQAELDSAQKPKRRRRYSRDPDSPNGRPKTRELDISTTSSMEDMLKRSPKRRNRANDESSSNRVGTRSKTETSATNAGSELPKDESTPAGE